MMIKQSGGKKAGQICVLFFSIVFFLYLAHIMTPFVPDDAYISFRYAKNLANGHGLSFNSNEPPVEGYSNFLWITLCSLLVHFGLELSQWGPRLATFFGLLNIYLLWLILRKRVEDYRHLAIPLILFAGSSPFILYSVSGMETPLFSFLLLFALFCVDGLVTTKQLWWLFLCSVIGGLAFMCRPEGIIVFPGIAFCLLFLKTKDGDSKFDFIMKPLMIASLLFVVILIAYNYWRINYFGEFLPTPFLSKGGHGVSLVKALKTNLHFYFVRQNTYYAPFGYYYAVLILLALAGITFVNRKITELYLESIALALVLLFVGVYFYFVDWMPGMRYHAGLVGIILIPASIFFTEFFFQKNGELSWQRKTTQFVFVVVVLVLLNLFALAQLKYDGSKRLEMSTVSSMIPLGRWLKYNVPSGTLIATRDIGAVAYFSDLPTLDINDESLTDLHIAKNGLSKEYFFKRSPQVVIILSSSLTRQLFGRFYDFFRDPRFSENYRFVGVTNFDWYRDRCYWTYIHNDIKLSPAQIKSFPKGLQLYYAAMPAS